MGDTRILVGRVEQFARHYHGPKFHALLCDPPYHLTSGASARGFMGKRWDGGNLAFQSDLWSALTDHLYPGAFGMAFASSRGWHRLAVAIEDAGLTIHPSIFGWLYHSGFPKATRIDTQLDRKAGVTSLTVDAARRENAVRSVYGKFASDGTGSFNQKLAVSDLATAWSGHRYGGQALKPALEPIIVFQKPYAGRPIDNMVASGAGALNIDIGRVGTSSDAPDVMGSKHRSVAYGAIQVDGGKEYSEGRWPANFITVTDQSVNDFYYNADWNLEVEELLASSDPVHYVPKASTEEREAGLSQFSVILASDITGRKADSPGLIGNIDLGYDHNPLAKVTSDRRNTHPTVKPIALAQYLASLLLPPDLYTPRRLLIPFSGSGSELIGAYRAGWDYTLGIEMDRGYVAIARSRLAYYTDLPDSEQTAPGVQQLSMFDDPT